MEGAAYADLGRKAFKQLIGRMGQAERDAAIAARAAIIASRKHIEKQANLILRKEKSRHRGRYPSEARMEAAMDGQPLPGAQCPCGGCRARGMEAWPVGYDRAAVKEMARELDVVEGSMVSYECWIHAQSDWFLYHLPSSSSVVRFQ